MANFDLIILFGKLLKEELSRSSELLTKIEELEEARGEDAKLYEKVSAWLADARALLSANEIEISRLNDLVAENSRKLGEAREALATAAAFAEESARRDEKIKKTLNARERKKLGLKTKRK